MKILRIVSNGYEQGGVENGIVLTNMLLRRHGHEVRTLTSDLRPDLPHYSDIEFKHVPTSGIRKMFSGTFNLSAYSVTKKTLAEFEPDVVLLHTMPQATASVLLLLKKYPTILFVHGPEVFTKELLPWYLPKDAYRHSNYELNDLTLYGRLRYYYFKNIAGGVYRLGMGNVNKIVALSNYTLGFMQKEGYSVVYIPNGARLLQPKPLQLSPPTLLYVGRLEKFKGVDDLIKAMPMILQVAPSARLQISGDGSYRADLEKLIKILHLENAVDVLGFMSTNQLDKLYSTCSVFVLPSTWPETFGKSGIEAMSVGRPVIATDVGGVRDWLVDGKNGYLIKSHHPEQIAKKTIALLTNEKRASKMAACALKTAQKFSIEQMVENIELLIHEYVTV